MARTGPAKFFYGSTEEIASVPPSEGNIFFTEDGNAQIDIGEPAVRQLIVGTKGTDGAPGPNAISLATATQDIPVGKYLGVGPSNTVIGLDGGVSEGGYMNATQKQLVMDAVVEHSAHVTPSSLNLVVVADTHSADIVDTGEATFGSFTRVMTNLSQCALAARIAAMDGIVHLGDLMDGGQRDNTSKADVLPLYAQFADVVNQQVPFFPMRGNHDDNSDYRWNSATYMISPLEWHQRWVRVFQNGVVYDSMRTTSNYYYRDFERQKIRCIFLDLCDYPWIVDTPGYMKYYADSNSSGTSASNGFGFGPEQVRWLHEEALDFSGKSDPSEWATVVFSHRNGNSNIEKFVNNGIMVMDILDAYNLKASYQGENLHVDWGVDVDADFSSDQTQGVLGFFQGHNHQDWTVPPYDETAAAIQRKNPWSYQITAFGDGMHSINGFSQLVTIDRDAGKIYTTTIADEAAIDATHTRRREIPIPLVNAPPAPSSIKLAQGNITAEGISVSVSGNRVTLNGTMTWSGTTIVNLTDGTLQATSGSGFSTTMYEPWITGKDIWDLTAGDLVTATIKNETGTYSGNTGAHGLLRPFFSDRTRPDAASAGPSASTTPPIPAGGPAPTGTLAVLVLAPTNVIGATYTDYSFEVGFRVNGVDIPVVGQ